MPNTSGVYDTVAVFGDVGGHAHALRRVLEKLGVQFDAHMRETITDDGWSTVGIQWVNGLHIVQVGDLVHRGPDSAGVILLVDRLIQLGVWTQVVGNHEQLYVDQPVFSWHEHIGATPVATLRDWWGNKQMHPSAAITPQNGERSWVITHAGVTQGFWERSLNKPGSAVGVTNALNAMRKNPRLWNPGAMLTGSVNLAAGPVWAEAGNETYLSWLVHLSNTGKSAPFNQSHGHSTAFFWKDNMWRCPDVVKPLLKADTSKRHITAQLGEQTIIGIDPAHDMHRSKVWAPLVIKNATVSV